MRLSRQPGMRGLSTRSGTTQTPPGLAFFDWLTVFLNSYEFNSDSDIGVGCLDLNSLKKVWSGSQSGCPQQAHCPAGQVQVGFLNSLGWLHKRVRDAHYQGFSNPLWKSNQVSLGLASQVPWLTSRSLNLTEGGFMCHQTQVHESPHVWPGHKVPLCQLHRVPQELLLGWRHLCRHPAPLCPRDCHEPAVDSGANKHQVGLALKIVILINILPARVRWTNLHHLGCKHNWPRQAHLYGIRSEMCWKSSLFKRKLLNLVAQADFQFKKYYD